MMCVSFSISNLHSRLLLHEDLPLMWASHTYYISWQMEESIQSNVQGDKKLTISKMTTA